jgi:uncharacterized membrane protein YuzA (DUF378 family)
MDSPHEVYYNKMFYKVAIVFLVIGALNWGLIGLMRVNFVERIFGKGSIISRSIYILVGLSALLVAFNRDTYLPFLGESVFPCSILSEQAPPGATRSIDVQVEPNSKVVYWASEPSDGSNIPTYVDAYRSYLNAGVAIADSTGRATLKVREPQPYSVPFKGHLESHIHFRVCGPTGFIGRIKTIFVANGRIEGYSNY